ncbi:MAG: thiamine pyrophosphate-binding protein [Ruminococcus sp.]
MNSSFRNVQILVDLLKQYKIKDVVLSPGGSDIPLIHSIETDEYFTCFSVVDERSAAYFAMGVALQKNVPVACVCTSGTAVCNYLPGITEAFYQSVPVLAITADKNPYYQGQLEIQKN